MSLFNRLLSMRTLKRVSLVFAFITAAYVLVSLALIFWPSPEPFADSGVFARNEQSIEPGPGDSTSSKTAASSVIFSARDGVSLFASHYPSDSDTSIILMHGIATTSSVFANAAKPLNESTGAEIFTPDFRGHGRSGGKRFDVNHIGQYEDDLEDIIRFIRRENPGNRVIVAGHSMGGGVAMRYALKDNAPIPDAYLLFAPNFGEGPTQRTGDTGDASSFVHFDLRRMIGIIMLNSIAIHTLDDLPILYFNGAPQVLEYSYRAVMSAQPIRPETSDIALQAVNSPLLVIVGANDEVFEAGAFEAFVSDHSDGKTVVLPGLTHDSVFNDPASFAAITQWYAELPWQQVSARH